LWSWINEGDSESDDNKRGWSGLQSIPRSIWLSENGDQLVQWPVKELDKLPEVLSSEVADPQILCTQKNASVSGSHGPFGLLVLASKDLTEHTDVFFRVFRSADSFRVLMCSDQTRWAGLVKMDRSGQNGRSGLGEYRSFEKLAGYGSNG
nr:putative glycoside hydrolase, family 32 [Tanacetum cinerariifolium]